MQFGVTTFLTDDGVDPITMGESVESAGFDALFLAEHTHVPTSRRTPYPPGGDLPRAYSHVFDPYIALSAIAGRTQRITLGTGISLANQHHPINLAKATASIDHISGGRFEMGVGSGWNAEEMENHGVDPSRRLTSLLERIRAIRTIWEEDEAEFHGTYVDFDPIWCWPKPVHRIPILLAGIGPTVTDRVLAHADGWFPVIFPHEGALERMAAQIADLRARADDMGRTVTVTLGNASPDEAAVESYARAGFDRILFEVPSVGREEALDHLERYASLIVR